MITKKVRRGEDAASPSRTGISTRDARATLNRLLWVGQLVITLNVVSTLTAEAAEGSFKFAGVPFSPGSTVRANVPLSAPEKSYAGTVRSEEHTSELQSHSDLVCRLLLEKKKIE